MDNGIYFIDLVGDSWIVVDIKEKIEWKEFFWVYVFVVVCVCYGIDYCFIKFKYFWING